MAEENARFTNKVAVVTGGAQGIGRATAELLAAQGAIAVIGDLSIPNAEELVQAEFKGSGEIYQGRLNVADETEVKSFFGMVVERFGTVDILVNNAGICRNAIPFEEVPIGNWKKVFDVNMFGTIHCANAVIPIMKEKRSGKIVNSTSVAAETGGIRTEASYAASKAANICLTMTLAKYLGPYGINVNAVSPGVINTDMTKELDPADLNTIPLRRIGEAKDVANTIAFLVSDSADYLTGVVIDVNGGMYMR